MMENQQIKDNPSAKFVESIKKFSASYKVLNPAGKMAFANQIKAQMRTMDARTKKLYEALLEATKEEKSIEVTIKMMEKADKEIKSGI